MMPAIKPATIGAKHSSSCQTGIALLCGFQLSRRQMPNKALETIGVGRLFSFIKGFWLLDIAGRRCLSLVRWTALRF